MKSVVLLVAPLMAGVALAQSDLPQRKSGLWLVTVTGTELPSDIPEIRFHECVDQKTDALLTKVQAKCAKPEVRRQGASYVQETVCKKNGSTGTSRVVFSGNFQSAYKGDVKMSYSPPYRGKKEDTGKIEGKWIGAACPPGRKPGWTMMLDDDEDEKKPPAKKR